MNIASKVAGRVVEIVKSSWYGSGWSRGGAGAGGSEGSHVANYTCLLASGYKAAYQEMADIKEAKDLGSRFHGDLNESDPVMDLVERAMAQAIRELYPKIAKQIDPSGKMDRCNLVMSFNDSHANREQAITVAERAQRIIEEHERMAEWVRSRKDVEIPSKFSFGFDFEKPDETDALAKEMDELLAESQEALRQAEKVGEKTEEPALEAEEAKPRRKLQTL